MNRFHDNFALIFVFYFGVKTWDVEDVQMNSQYRLVLSAAEEAFSRINDTLDSSRTVDFEPQPASSYVVFNDRQRLYQTGPSRSESPEQPPPPPPEQASEPKMLGSNQTLMSLLKGNVGTGVLAMPVALKYAGILVGTLGIFIMGMVCTHCMFILVHSAHRLARRAETKIMGYAEVAEKAFELGPRPFQRLSKFAKGLVNLFLCLTQLGFCCVYFVFISTTLVEVVRNLSPGVDLSFHVYLSIILPVTIVYCFIRSQNVLSYFSTFGNLLEVTGMVVIFYNLFTNIPSISQRPLVAGISEMSLFFGSVVFAFEGIALVLPLEAKMRTPARFLGCSGVLNTGMIIAVCLYTAIGFFGFLKYGDDAQGSITLNLEHSPLNETIRIFFAIAIFFTYGLQFSVPIEILWPSICNYLQLDDRYPSKVLYLELIFRTILVLITFILAAAIPKLDLFISLVGALASSSLSLIFPPVLEILAFWDYDYSKPVWILICTKNALISLLGIIGFVTGTYSSVHNIFYG